MNGNKHADRTRGKSSLRTALKAVQGPEKRGSSFRSDTVVETKRQYLSARPFVLTSKTLQYEHDLYQWLDSAKDIRLFKHRVTQELGNLGLSDWEYIRLDIPLAVSFDKLVGADTRMLRKCYLHDAFYECDLILDHAMTSTAPLFHFQIDAFLSIAPCEGEVIRRNKAWSKIVKNQGYLDSINIPILSPCCGGRALFSALAKHVEASVFQRRVYANMDKILLLPKLIDEIGCRNFPAYFLGKKKDYEQLKCSKSIALLSLMGSDDLTLNMAADRLCLSISSAEKCIATLRTKLGVKTTYGAITRALKEELIKG